MATFRHVISILTITSILGAVEPQTREFHFLSPGVPYKRGPHSQDKLSIFCYRGVPKHIFHVWQTVYVSTSLQPQNYNLYHGHSPEEVFKMHEDHKSSWTSQLFTWRRKIIQLDPFNCSCIGIETSLGYEIGVNVIRLDVWKVILLIFGVFMFLAAPRLSSNPVFYYLTGISLGITTSVLITFYLISKLIPKKPAVYGFLAGGWTVSIYILQILWDNIRVIALNYQREVLGYVVVTGIISFIICYRFGPVTDPRSRNLIKWALQCVSLVAIFYSSAYQELSVLVILGMLLYYNFPPSWTSWFLLFWKKIFPPKTKLLTEDEYHEQGARETVKALDELRKYCSSPECKQWRTILALSEPIRFAQFVEGKSHLADAEILEYEAEARKSQFTDDDSSGSEY